RPDGAAKQDTRKHHPIEPCPPRLLPRLPHHPPNGAQRKHHQREGEPVAAEVDRLERGLLVQRPSRNHHHKDQRCTKEPDPPVQQDILKHKKSRPNDLGGFERGQASISSCTKSYAHRRCRKRTRPLPDRSWRRTSPQQPSGST